MVYFRLIEDLPERTPLGYGPGGGRWNSFGAPIIYACNCSSLNFLELLSIKGSIVTTSSWLLVRMEIMGDIPSLSVDHLPDNWTERPYSHSTQEFGTQWLKRRFSPFLKVPSCRIPVSRFPQEHNLLINPLHETFTETVNLWGVEKVSFEMNK